MFKLKIFNDPIYGFITVKSELIYALIEHPYFQRLRRIKQLGMTHLVYPGALHTRFHHAMGAMHLMNEALETLKDKGTIISAEEHEAACIAILLHDIGHGPFSHALETSIVSGFGHEELSVCIMEELNKQFSHQLNLAISIFRNTYQKKFLHQLVSSQLDVDRLDYLNRDSFFTGVSEGVISWDRIIKTLNVVNDNLVVDEKGIYSVEKFLISRRLMYWQVYLHKTVLSAENLLVQILHRAKELKKSGATLFATPAFDYFLSNEITHEIFKSKKEEVLSQFTLLDDYDIFTSIKVWSNHSDKVLSWLCTHLVNRNLFKIELQNFAFEIQQIDKIQNLVASNLQLNKLEVRYLVFSDSIKNSTYNSTTEKINIHFKNGKLVDIAEASDQLNIQVLSNTVEKFFLCSPKDIDI